MARGGSAGAPAASGSFYGRESFNPGVIVGQVIVIQLVFYFSNALALMLFDYMLNIAPDQRPGGGASPLVLDQMLNHAVLSLETAPGVVAAGAFAAATIVGCPVAFVMFVGRSKRALDFAATLLLAHLVCCTMYGGFPSNPLWWALVLFCGICMTLLCEVWSRRFELRDIALPSRDPEDPSTDDEDEIRPA
jgi:Integral membrane protein S linking to the trans Golgi network